jgi:hypothetical protein
MIEASVNIRESELVKLKELVVLEDGKLDRMRSEIRSPRKEPASSFYRHKEGRCTCTGVGSRRLLPESGGAQWMSTVEGTL